MIQVTDEMVDAALDAYNPDCCAVDERKHMRAAIEAALAASPKSPHKNDIQKAVDMMLKYK